MKIEIKEALLKDAERVALLAQITFRQAFSHFWSDEQVLRNYFKKTFSVEKIRNSIAKANNKYWIAYADELPVGYAKLKINCPYEKLSDPKPAQLQKIYLLQDYIAQGIGEQLQNVLFEEVRKQNIKTLWLAVWDENDKAIRFYERHGFKKETTYHYDFEKISIDYYVMTKLFQ
jgi:ribosomal protein S18 acetylase RimI-like enzyme